MNGKSAKKSSKQDRKKTWSEKVQKKFAKNTEQYHSTCNLSIFRYFWIL